MAIHPLLRRIKKLTARVRKRNAGLSIRLSRSALHDHRVDLKRLRALFRLLNAVDPAFRYKACYGFYKPLFALAGTLRELQLQMALVKQTREAAPPFKKAYLLFLSRQLRAARTEWRDYLQAYEEPSWAGIRTLTEQAVARCRRPALRAYFQGLAREFVQIKSAMPAIDDECLHRLRRIIKDHRLNRMMLKKVLQFDPGSLPGLPEETRDLEDRIGRWHDLVVAAGRLAADMDAAPWSYEQRAAGQTCIKTWWSEASELRDSIVQSITGAAVG